MDGDPIYCTGYVDVSIYCDDRTDLQGDKTLRRVHELLVGTETKVHVTRRPMPCTLVVLTWVDTVDVG